MFFSYLNHPEPELHTNQSFHQVLQRFLQACYLYHLVTVTAVFLFTGLYLPTNWLLLFLIRNLTIFSDRKYFGSTFSSKMSDNEHSFPILGDSEVFAVKNLPLILIPQVGENPKYCLESFSLVMTK